MAILATASVLTGAGYVLTKDEKTSNHASLSWESDPMAARFESWKAQHGKKYGAD